MPYTDPLKKKEWEQRHRNHRAARRRELRRIEAARAASQPPPPRDEGPSGSFLFPLLVGGALAAHNPKLAIGAGGLTLVVAAAYKKDWSWWVVGTIILALGIFFQWNKRNEKK